MHYDKFGNAWPDGPGYENEYCKVCGQPDNCGDCTHEPLTPEDVLALGGTPRDGNAQSLTLAEEDALLAAHDERPECSGT